MTLNRHIFLIGFMGVGKSANAERLARLTGAALLEMDREIVKNEGMEISEIFRRHGEEYFRDLETELLRTLADRAPTVVSCGGGAVLRKENVRLMKRRGTIVLLTASPETVLERVKDREDRPILDGKKSVEEITKLMEGRQQRYGDAADVTVSTDGRGVEEICGEILKKIEPPTCSFF